MKRILIIDDDIQIRQMLRQMLEREGYEVNDASNGAEGIELYRDAPFDLIITDIIMPEKEGLETIMELKGDFQYLKIIAISGGGRIDSKDYLKIAKKFGADRTFSKPFDREELLAAIEKLLSNAVIS